jgi:predicted outer membrane repeat protein
MLMNKAERWRISSSTHHYGCQAIAAIITIFVFCVTSAEAATITVNSLADPGEPGICVLRDAITAANTATAVNGCAAGSGDDTIVFSVTGTITLTTDLPTVTNTLTIKGPAAASSSIIINGASAYSVTDVDSGATLNLDYLTIENANGGDGGGIFNGGTLTVTNCTFASNSGDGGGGIYNDGSGTLTVTNSTFTGNSAEGGGGGILNDGTLTVTNSTFASNSGDFGGGIYNDDGTLTVTNSTFTGNSAESFGGGIYNFGSETVDIKGTILASSTSNNCLGGFTDEGFNLDGDGSCGFSSGTTPNSDLALDPNGLQNNGGPTETVALESNSVAINQIPVADCTDQSSPPVRLFTDQRGVIRPQFTACDIGAYEYDTARSLKTNVLSAITATSGLSRKQQQKLKLAAGSLYQASLLLTGSGNSLSPALGGLEFQTEETAVQLLTSLTPSSQLSSSTLGTWLFNITLADRTLAVVAIASAGGNADASQLVADGDAAVASGYYLQAIKDYAEAWSLVRSY